MKDVDEAMRPYFPTEVWDDLQQREHERREQVAAMYALEDEANEPWVRGVE